MTGHGAKFGRKKQEAIAALIAQRNVEEAARVVGLGPQTLYRWLKIPEFETEFSAARKANAGQAFGRLQRGSVVAVVILMKVMHDPDAPRSARLRAADRVLTCVKGTTKVEEMGARLWALHNGRRVAKSERRGKTDCAAAPANEGASSRKPGHGAKFGRKKEEAIAALLSERNVEEAARATGIGTTTLYRWLRDPEFGAEYLRARLTAFGPTGVRLQQAANPAATTILKIMVDSATTAHTQVTACDLVLKHALISSEEDLETWLSELNSASQAVPTVFPAGRRSFGEIVGARSRERPEEAA